MSSSSPWVTSRLRTKGWKFGAELHRVGRVHVDGLNLASQALVSEERVHHHQRVAQDQPVHPPVLMLVRPQQPVVNGQVTLAEQVEQVDLALPRMALQRLENRRRRKPLVDEKRQRRHVEGQPLGLPGPVEKGLGQPLQRGGVVPGCRELCSGLGEIVFRNASAVRGIDDRRQLRDALLQGGDPRLALLPGRILSVPVQGRRERRVVAVGGRRLLLAELRLHADVGPQEGARLGMGVTPGAPPFPRPARLLLSRCHLCSSLYAL